jgi:outer membrane protein assembly factor BamE (lipoprotein component of BamABCDE complex)
MSNQTWYYIFENSNWKFISDDNPLTISENTKQIQKNHKELTKNEEVNFPIIQGY